MDIQFTVNGRPSTFNFRKKDFRSFIKLEPGNNEVIVTATNNAGSDSDVVNIFYEQPYTDPNNDPNYSYPTVQISNPPYDDFRTDQERFEVRADVRNIASKRDIQVTVNGYEINRFDYIRGTVQARVDLRNGRNEIRIEVRNNDGFASDDATVILGAETNDRPPTVDITRPSANPYNTSNRNVTIEARINNITDIQDIRYIINGNESTNFDFTNGLLSANLTLSDYRTSVVIEARNNDGQASDNTVILWKEDIETIDKPVITITSVSNPTVDPFNPENCKSTVIATILNIEDRNDIDLWLNGARFSNFDFNSTTQVFQATVQLRPGSNQIRIKATNAAGSDEDTATTEGCNTQPNDKDLPEVTITEPSSNNQQVSTSIATVNAKVLNVSSKSNITFKLNGNSTNSFTYNKFTKVVSAKVNLKEGSNTIYIEAQNNDGSANDQVNIIYRKTETVRPPTVKIERPRNNSITSEERVELIAKVRNVESKSDIDVFLNGRKISNFDYSKRKQEVRANLNLTNGNNTVRVVGSNDAGTNEASATVKYVPEVKRPVVDISKPSNGVVTDKSVNLIATVKNVKSKNDITVTLNRRPVRFNMVKNEVRATLNIGTGNNLIIVKASNEGGTDQDEVTVVYEPPVVKRPIVEIKSPKDNQTVKTSRADITATVLYVKSRRSITLTVNGKAQSFNYQRGTLTASIGLGEGRNTVRVRAKNNDGEAEDQVTIIYKKKVVPKPLVQFTAPAKNGAKVYKAKYKVKALVKNVKEKRDITLKLNGKAITRFRFNTRNGEVQADVSLAKGRNNLVIEARNASGKDTEQSSVIYERKVEVKNPPKVTITSVSNPTVDPFDPNKAKSTVIAKIENVKSKRDITFEFNNKKVTNFSYSNKTGIMQATMDLKKGTNTFDIKVTNKDGQDQASRNIKFGDDGGTSRAPSRHGKTSSSSSSNGGSKSRRGGK